MDCYGDIFEKHLARCLNADRPTPNRFMLTFLCSSLIRAVFFSVILSNVCLLCPSARAAEGMTSMALPDWPRILEANQESLAHVESDQAATEVFVGQIGPAAALNEAAATIRAKGIPAKLAKELLVQEITRSAQRLVAALAAWQLAERMTRSLVESPGQVAMTVSPSQMEWLLANGPFPSLGEVVKPTDNNNTAATAVAVGRLAQEAGLQAMAEWWRLKTWKDRVRVARGQSRLCGTWQWVIHNHQRHHEEQKLSLIFPPPGKDGTGIPGLSEIIVLGDVVYLRWETEGKTQEDSLLFSKEGQRLEGTFVNSQGGWGSISGKRTASCTLQ